MTESNSEGENSKDYYVIEAQHLTKRYNDFLAVDNLNLRIKKGEVFVLGDNRKISLDSRVLGPIKMKDIKGHVVIRVYPFSKIRLF